MKYKAAQNLSKVIGAYQIVGGLIILILGLNQLLFNFSVNVFFVFYTFIAIGLSSLSIYTGIKCYKATSFGIIMTFYNQVIQLLHFIFWGFEYMYNPGLGLYIGIDFTREVIFLHKLILPYIKLGKEDSGEIVILINLIPLFIILILESINKGLKSSPNAVDDIYLT